MNDLVYVKNVFCQKFAEFAVNNEYVSQIQINNELYKIIKKDFDLTCKNPWITGVIFDDNFVGTFWGASIIMTPGIPCSARFIGSSNSKIDWIMIKPYNLIKLPPCQLKYLEI